MSFRTETQPFNLFTLSLVFSFKKMRHILVNLTSQHFTASFTCPQIPEKHEQFSGILFLLKTLDIFLFLYENIFCGHSLEMPL